MRAGAPWVDTATGVILLPSGRTVRGRGVETGLPDGPEPEWGLYLLARRPPPTPWPQRWVRWPDFGLPLRRREAVDAIHEAHRRAVDERVEVACGAGAGRTGTALACLVVLDGLEPEDAITLVRRDYHRRAVETPWQAGFVDWFARTVLR